MGLAETQKETDLGKPQLQVYHCVALAKLSKRMCLLSCILKWGKTVPLNVLRNHQLFEDNRYFLVEDWRLGSDSMLNASGATVQSFDLEQVIYPLCASVSSFVRWGR